MNELYSVNIDGSSQKKIHPGFTLDYQSVGSYLISPNSSRVVLTLDKDGDGIIELLTGTL